jgi:antitoxin component YwqK of YwqJK toxin-antitoxin module
VLCCGLIFSCNTESEKNKDKRNENWCWWVDDDSGKGMWIPIKNKSTVENGRYTLFYFNGNVYEKGTMTNKKRVDTTFFYNPSGKCYGYQVDFSDTGRIYYYKDGRYKIYYNSGSLYYVGIVTNHYEGDQLKVFYKNGKLSSDRKWKNGVGFTPEYFKNGKRNQ